MLQHYRKLSLVNVLLRFDAPVLLHPNDSFIDVDFVNLFLTALAVSVGKQTPCSWHLPRNCTFLYIFLNVNESKQQCRHFLRAVLSKRITQTY